MYLKKQIETALTLLGEKLMNNKITIRLLVCGGSALIMTNTIDRATKDVDILSLKTDDNLRYSLLKTSKLPDFFQKYVLEVANDLALNKNWINTEPFEIMRIGLPKGYENRIITKKFSSLIIDFIGRFDQIHLKVYASVDQGPGKHFNDLLLLKPTSEEIYSAALWSLKYDNSETFVLILIDMLRKMKYETIAESIQREFT